MCVFLFQGFNSGASLHFKMRGQFVRHLQEDARAPGLPEAAICRCVSFMPPS
jgi:hypothetical protein